MIQCTVGQFWAFGRFFGSRIVILMVTLVFGGCTVADRFDRFLIGGQGVFVLVLLFEVVQ